MPFLIPELHIGRSGAGANFKATGRDRSFEGIDPVGRRINHNPATLQHLPESRCIGEVIPFLSSHRGPQRSLAI